MTVRPGLEDIFSEAIAIASEAERAIFLARACGEDLDLRARVDALVEAHREAGSFLVDSTRQRGGAQYLTVSAEPSTVHQIDLIDSEIGPYKLRELIGEGGMGVVYLAEQERPLRRKVALKIIKPGMDSRQVVARFEAERQALAIMDHPHIARVFDGGVTPSGRPYFAMELVQGLAITTYCNRRQLTVEERLALFIDVCHAVEHAHSKQIVHRDLKPSNVMITHCDGRALAKVIDFGIARAIGNTKLTDKTLFTEYSMFLGTPAYMSPEQAALSAVDVDERSDVYSLGILLYELLTGSPPLASEQLGRASYDEVRRLIREVEPLPPSVRISTVRSASATTLSVTDIEAPPLPEFERGIARELDWIVLKALDKDRSRRYQSAASLAADLLAFLRDEPVSAYPRTKLYRLTKLAKRHKTMLAASVLMVGLLSVLTLSWNSVLSSHERAASAEKHRQLAANQVEEVQFEQAMQRASSALRHGRTEDARTDLLPWAQASSPHRERFELHFLLRRIAEPLTELRQHQYDLLDMDVSADSRWLASSDRGGDIVLSDCRSGQEVGRLHPSDTEVTRVRFSPDGNLLASVGVDTKVRIWQTADQTELVALTGHEHTINGLDWSPDGSQLATGDRDGIVRVWDLQAQTCRHILPQHAGPVRCLVWSPDGKWLATADGDSSVRVWETHTWTEVKSIDNEGHGTLAIAFSGDSEYFAFGGYGGKLAIVEVRSLEVIQTMALTNQIQSIAFGNRLAMFVGLFDGSLEILHCGGSEAVWKRLRLATELKAERNKVRAVIPKNSANVLWVGCEQGRTIRSYSLTALLGGQKIAPPPLPVGQVTESQRVVTSDFMGNAGVLRHADTGVIQLSFTDSVNRWCVPQFVPARDLLLIACYTPSNAVKVIRRSDGLLLKELAFPNHLHTLSVSRDGHFAVGAGWDGKVRVWDLSTFKAKDLMEASGPYGARAQFSPHEDILVLGQGDTRQLSLLKAGTWEPIRQVHTDSAWYAFTFFRNENWLAVSGNGWASLWNGDLTELRWSTAFTTGEEDKIENLALSFDESAIFGYSSQSTLRAWNTQSGHELFAWDLPCGACRWLNFADEQTLHIEGTDTSLRLDRR